MRALQGILDTHSFDGSNPEKKRIHDQSNPFEKVVLGPSLPIESGMALATDCLLLSHDSTVEIIFVQVDNGLRIQEDSKGYCHSLKRMLGFFLHEEL